LTGAFDSVLPAGPAIGTKEDWEGLVRVAKTHGLSACDLAVLAREHALAWVPVSMFATTLTPLEALTKYLRDQECLPFKNIAVVVHRNESTVRNTHKRAVEKYGGVLPLYPCVYWFPLSVLADRRLTLYEHVVAHLWYRCHLRSAEIARVLRRDQAMILNVLHRIELRLKHDTV
jgi:hypothetical protein